MRRLIVVTLLAALVSGCPAGYTPPAEKAALKPFGSEQELADYFADQVNAQNNAVPIPSREELADAADGDSAGGAGGAPTAPTNDVSADSGDDSFSGTTIQEEGVDEADVVKTDGTYLYVIQNNYEDSNSLLKIISVDQLAVVGEIALSGYARELYLHGSRVVALTETYGNFFYLGGGGVAVDPISSDPRPVEGESTEGSDGSGGMTDDGNVSSDEPVSDIDLIAPTDDLIAPDYGYARPKSIVTVIDAAAPNLPTRVSTTEFDGTQSSSRMIDGMLHMVVSNYQSYYFDVLPLLGRPQMTMDEADPQDMLPHYRHVDAAGNETEGMVLTWENVYRPEQPDGFGVLAVVSMNADNSDTFRAVGVVAEPGLIYSSLDALYITNTNYDFRGDMRTTTDIFKFRYEGDLATPVAAGRVSGRILNQYSMGESNGYLRVATTSDPVFNESGEITRSTNNVYVVGENAGSLEVVGSIESIAPGETIQSARFLGDRGYLVTFEQIDPLFTLDLSDPFNPRTVGELKVPGFSTFIVPMDENNILTIGEYIADENNPFFWPRAVQLSIFNVSDFANPVLAHQEVIGADTGAYSEAQYNPKAFTYFAERGLLALPVSIQEYFGGGVTVIDIDVDADGAVSGGGSSGSEGSEGMDAAPPPDGGDGDSTGREDVIDDPGFYEPYIPGGYEGLFVYTVSPETGFSEVGRLSTRFEDAGYYYSSYTRGVFIGDIVYAVTDNGVRSAPITDMAGTTSELLLREPNPYYTDVPVEPGVDPEKPDDIVVDDGMTVEPEEGVVSPAGTTEQ